MLTAVFSALRRKWLVWVPAALVTAAVSFGLSFVMRPMYRVELTLSPVGEMDSKAGLAALAGQLGGLMSASGLSLGQGRAKNEGLALLRSRSFIADYINEKNLMPILYPDDFPSPGSEQQANAADLPTVNDAVTSILDNLMSVKDDPKSGLITLEIDWRDPQVALTWARDLVTRVNEATRARDIREAREGVAYLDDELTRTSQVGVRDAIGRVLQDQLQTSMMANVRREYAFRVLDPGMIPDRPVRPRKLRMLLTGFALGAFVAGFIVCAREGAFTPKNLA